MRQWKIIFLFFLTLAAFANPSCPQNCEQCTQDGAMCFACKPNYESSVQGKCVSTTIQNCILYGQNMECFRCQPLFAVSPDASKCIRNTNGCLNDGQDGECFQCGFGTLIKDSKCVGILNCATPAPNGGCLKCADGFQLAGKICRHSSLGCAEIQPQDGTCSKCSKGYFLSGYRCFQEKNKILNCYLQQSDFQCRICKGGYNQLGPKCLLNKQMSVASFSGGNQFASFNQVNENQANGDFGFPSGPTQVRIQNCQVVDNSICIICTYGFYPLNNKCAEVSKLCDGHDVQTGKCFACKFGLTLNSSGSCVDVNCTAPGKDNCQQCKPGFKTNQNGVCIQFDPNCLNSLNGVCQSCKPSFYADKVGKCKPLPSNCLTANIQTGFCLECIKDFEIIAPGSPCTKKIVIENCQVPDQKNIGKCLICVERYFPDGNKCLKVSNQCKDYNPQNGKCTTCSINGLNVEDGKCVDPNCLSRNNEVCPSCKPNFIFNNVEKICKFNDPNCKNLGPISCKQCKSGYYISLQNNCQPLPSNCQQADQSGICILCTFGFQLNQRNCVKPLQPPLNENKTSNQLQPQNQNKNPPFTQSQGINYGVQTNDLNCRQFNSGRCSKCSNRFYVGPEGRCVPVNPLCKDSNQMGECTACYPGYRVDSGKCIIAGSTDSNCKSFSGLTCNECYKGFFYNTATKQCKKVNPLCKNSNPSTGACTICYPGYTLNQISGNCLVSLRDPNCRNFSPEGSCLSCSARYYLNSNGKCTPANPLCKQYNPQTGACTVCYPGYGLSGNTCLQGLSKDPNCKTFQGQNCQNCVNGFYIGPDGKCKQASPLCKTFDPRSGACLTCYNGYEVSNSACIITKSQDPNCKNYNNNLCTACYSGFLAIGGKCLTQNPLCKTVDMNNGGCTSCWPGYAPVDNNCVVQKPNQGNSGIDPYCQKFINGVCQQCSNGYYYNDGDRLCQSLDPICKTHDMRGGFCTSCYDGYSLVDKKCHQSIVVQIPNCLTIGANGLCEQCDEGYFLGKNNQCKIASPYCKNYNKINGQCTECNGGYFFQDNQCIYPALFDSNCQRYESSYCSKCRRGFYISNYSCIAVDQNCVEFNDRTNQCIICANNMQPIGQGCI